MIGRAAHRLLEEAGSGKLCGLGKEAIESRWEELVQEIERRMQSSWLHRGLIPLREAVAYYEVRRLQVVARAAELAASRAVVPGSIGAPAHGYGYELAVRSRDGLMTGVIDAVVPSVEGPVIRDYKTGALPEPVGGGRQARYDHTLQIKLYAVLYAETFGCWPARLQLVPLAGEPMDVSFDENECTLLASEAKEELQSVNASIASCTSPAAAVAALARPSPETCRSCTYRPGCTRYWKVAGDPPGIEWPADVRGRLREVKHLLNGQALLEVQTSRGVARVRGIDPDLSRHAALKLLRPQQNVAVFNLRREGTGLQFAETCMTVIYADP